MRTTQVRGRLIDRPDFAPTRGRAPRYPYSEILATLGTDQALLIPAKAGVQIEQIISAVGKTVRRRGYRFRHRRENGGVAVWVERKA